MDVLGLCLLAAFYAAILALGVVIARRGSGEDADRGEFILAGRSLGVGVGICTLVATEVGGAFVNGTAEEV